MIDLTKRTARGTCALLALAVALAFGAGRTAQGQDLVQTARQLQARYRTGLDELAQWCQSRGLKDEAQKTRQVLPPSNPFKLYLPVLPKRAGPAPLPEGASEDVVQWNERLTTLRQDQANALFDLARRAAKAQRASLAYELAVSAVWANPDHEGVRRLMGHQKIQGQWCTAYEARKLRAGQVWSDKFGWLAQGQLARYERGEHYYRGKWILAEEDARLHRDIQSGWDVETEHYTIRTNHSIEAAVAVGVKLEQLYRVWQQLFVRYYASEAQLVALFDGRNRTAQPDLPRHHVVYFRDKADYDRALRSELPKVEMTIGVYLQQPRRAYFFAAAEPDDRTLYHEATHQLFHEARPVPADVGARANFWIIEGVAMYMESLRREGDFWVLGGFDDDRVHAAGHRLLVDHFYVPFSELCTYGMQRLQADPRIATIYSQAAGQANFLVYFEGGRYRDALVAYLNAVYSARDDAGTLARLTGTPYTELDNQYRQFIQQGVKQAEQHPAD